MARKLKGCNPRQSARTYLDHRGSLGSYEGALREREEGGILFKVRQIAAVLLATVLCMGFLGR